MNPPCFLSECLLFPCFYHPWSNPVRALVLQRFVLFIWWLVSKRQEAETARVVKGHAYNWCIITSDKFCCSHQSVSSPRLITLEKSTPSWRGSGKRMCGMGDTIVTIFGKNSMPRWQDQKTNSDWTSYKPRALNHEAILLHMFRRTAPSPLENSWTKGILVLLNH